MGFGRDAAQLSVTRFRSLLQRCQFLIQLGLCCRGCASFLRQCFFSGTHFAFELFSLRRGVFLGLGKLRLQRLLPRHVALPPFG